MLFSVLAIGLVIIVLAVVVVASRKQAKQSQAMEAFALEQGWKPLGNDPAELRAFLPVYLNVMAEVGSGYHAGATFSRSEEAFNSAYAATVDEHQTVFFQYDLTEYYTEVDASTGQQKEVSTSNNFLVVSADLDGNVPAALLVHHSLLSKLASFSEYKGMQQLKLEGDFNDHFDKYILPDTQDVALELLTPDTMELLAAMTGASMEFSGRSVAVSWEAKPVTPGVIVPLLELVSTVMANVRMKPESKAVQV